MSGSRRLANLVEDVGKTLGRSREDVKPFLALLEDNWYDSVRSLRGVSAPDLSELGLPQRFAKELIGAVQALEDDGDRRSTRDPPHSHSSRRDDRPPHSSDSRDADSINRLIRNSGLKLDEQCKSRLHTASPADVKEALGDPGLHTARNASALVSSRLSHIVKGNKGNGKGYEDSKGKGKDSKGKGKDSKGKGKGKWQWDDGRGKGKSKGRDRDDEGRKFAYTHKITFGIQEPDGLQDDESIRFLRNNILGDHGRNLNHIRDTYGAHVLLLGRGSNSRLNGDIEGSDPDEPLHIVVQADDADTLEDAKTAATDLIDTILERFSQWIQDNEEEQSKGSRDRGDRDGDRFEYSDRDRRSKGKGKGKGSRRDEEPPSKRRRER
eukprot:TRINITY_DN6440_c0_g1_i1.p1 TRINITY_DN6440_c0_g1~~TRINITY_DN6440_c0_g1_i1.p1  ORF type:complete len:380 (+),score=51.29 TRINITY_DN6440_c0_g1_i1:84-1223(+)